MSDMHVSPNTCCFTVLNSAEPCTCRECCVKSASSVKVLSQVGQIHGWLDVNMCASFRFTFSLYSYLQDQVRKTYDAGSFSVCAPMGSMHQRNQIYHQLCVFSHSPYSFFSNWCIRVNAPAVLL